MDNPPRPIYSALFLAGLGYLIYRVLADLFEPVTWAMILVYASWPLHVWLRRRLGGSNGWSALALVLALGALVLMPLLTLSVILQGELADFLRQLPGWLESKPELPSWIARIPLVGDELRLVFDQFENLQGMVRQYGLPKLTNVSGKLLGMLEGAGFLAAKWVFTLFLMFFFYRDGDGLAGQVRQGLARGLGGRADAYLATAEATTKAVFYGIVMTAIAQGAVAGLGYWGVGMQAPALLTLFTMFIGLIPFGTVAMWVGASLWLVFHGQHWAGVALFLWGALVVSWVDNVVRPLVISRTTRIPFVLVLLGVLGGLTGFGFIGLFVGPVILAVGLAVWREWLGKGNE